MRTFFKIFGAVLLVLVLLVVVAVAVFEDRLAEYFLKNRIAKAGYVLRLQELDLDLLEGTVVLKEIELSPAAGASDTLQTPFQQARVASLALRGVNFWQFITDKALVADSLLIEDVAVQLQRVKTGQSANPGDWRDQFYSFDIYNSLPAMMDKVVLRHVVLRQGTLIQKPETAGTAPDLLVKGLYIQLQDVSLDKNTFFTKERFLYSRQLSIGADTAYITTAKRELQLMEPRLQIESNVLELSLQQLELQQPQTAAAGEKELLLKLDTLSLTGANSYQLVAHRKLLIDSLLVRDAYLSGQFSNVTGNTAAEDTTISLATFSLLPLITPTLKEVAVNELEILSAQLQLADLEMEEVSLQLHELLIDSLPAFMGNRFLHARQFVLQSDSALLQLKQHTTAAWAQANIRYQQGKGALTAVDVVMQLPESEIVLPRVALSALEFYTEIKKVKVGEAVFLRPAVTSRNFVPTDKGNERSFSLPASLQQYIQPFIQQLVVGELSIQEGRFLVELTSERNRLLCPVFNASATDIVIDDRLAFAEDRFWHAQQARFDAHDVSYYYFDRRYQLQSELIAMNANAETLLARQLELHTLAPDKNSWYDVPYEKAYDLSVDKITLDGIEWEPAFLDKYLSVDLLALQGVDYKTYVDRIKNTDKIEPMPQELLRVPVINYHIAAFRLEDGSITYRERAPEADTTGVFYVTDINARAAHISDHPLVLREFPQIKLVAQGRLMNRAPARTETVIHMLSPQQLVEMEGEVGRMLGSKFNSITKYTSPVLIEEGLLLRSYWNFTATEKKAEGKFQLLYKDLSVGINTGDNSDTEGIFQDLASSLVNFAVVEEERLPQEEEVSPVHVTNERDPTKGFLNYYWKTLLVGIKECIGVPSL